MSSGSIATKRVACGLYEVVGFTCNCGGAIRIERDPPDRERTSGGDFLWESFCTRCKVCDANGWPTLCEALAHAEQYFGGSR